MIGDDPRDPSTDSSKRIDVLTEGEPHTSRTPSVLGRRSYIDDILIPATSWAYIFTKEWIDCYVYAKSGICRSA